MAAFFNKSRMVVSVLKAFAVAIVIMIILLWFLGGGVGTIISTAKNFHFTSLASFLSASSTGSFANFQLPWQIEMPQVSVTGVSDDGSDAAGAPSHASFANASPYAGEVTIQAGAAQTQSASGQYIELDASGNGAPIDISGWSLESALSGVRVYLPQASAHFTQGSINAVSDVLLASGESALVVTGPSPVGVSFRENECTGYLGTLQPFVPALPQECPSPTSAIPETASNEANLGASCFQYLAQLPLCTFSTSPPSSLGSACVAEIQNVLSYNGCVSEYQNDPSFEQSSWRLYLAQGTPLWNGQHDVIRLLDAQGRIVDIFNY